MANPQTVPKHLLLTTKPAAIRIAEFRNDRSENYAFSFLDKTKFLTDLLDRVSVIPGKNINQDTSSLCGPAAVLYIILIRQKDVFVNFAINLFQYGEAYLGKMHIKPSQATRNIKAGALGDMSQVDWVVLASLRDSQNSMLRYDEKSDKISGITYPYEVEAWCQQIGFRQVINKTNLIFSKGIDNLMQAQQCLMSGYSVCLLINLNILISNNPNTPSYLPNHWVVLTSNIIIDGLPINPSSSKKLVKERIDYYSDTYDVNSDLVYGETFNHDIKFQVYSWGVRNRPLGAIQNGSVDLTTFLNYYYGFVAAKSLKL